MLLRILLVVFGTALLAGCGDASLAILPPDHPANPQAEQAPYTPLRDVFQESTLLAIEDQAEGHADLPAEMHEQVDRMIRAYVALAELLAKDEHEGAAEHVTEIHKAAHALDEVENEKVQELAGRIAKAAHGKSDDLKTARETFKALAGPVIELVHLSPPAHAGAPILHEVYCPMAKASWLQKAEKVANPYFGREMPNCGKITHTIKPRTGGHEHKHED